MNTTFEMIGDSSRLARFFNGVMSDLGELRALCTPGNIMDDKEMRRYTDGKFCDLCRHEIWMHETVSLLRYWQGAIAGYMEEYGGSWKYYAAAKRMLAEKTVYAEEAIELEDSSYYSYSFMMDILNSKKRNAAMSYAPSDLRELCTDVIGNAHTDFFEMFKGRFGDDVHLMRVEENGSEREVTQEEHVLDEIARQVKGEDDAKVLLAVGGGVYGILNMLEECPYNQDNKEVLKMVSDACGSLLRIDLSALNRAIMNFSAWKDGREQGI